MYGQDEPAASILRDVLVHTIGITETASKYEKTEVHVRVLVHRFRNIAKERFDGHHD